MELITFDNVLEVLEEYAREVRNLYQDNLIRSDRIATGNLLNSVEYRVDFDGQAYEVKLSLAEYWKYVEDDTRPHWPPVSAILKWIQAKPVLPRPDANGRIPTPQSLAYLIGRKISREGTEGSHDLRSAIETVNDRYRGKLVIALHRDTQQLMKVLVGEIRGSMPGE